MTDAQKPAPLSEDELRAIEEREVYAEELDMMARETVRLLATVRERESSLEFTRQWYAERFERLRKWAHELPEDKRHEYFSIVANGTANILEPPTHAQLLNHAKHRAEAAEEKVRAQQAEIERLRAEQARWRAALQTHASRCETCEGDGFMDVVVGHTAPDEREISEPEPCGECGGTGRGAVREAIEDARRAERDACCAILASAEPNTRAEQAIERIHERVEELPGWLAGEIGDWLDATGDELRDLQKLIRARGATQPGGE